MTRSSASHLTPRQPSTPGGAPRRIARPVEPFVQRRSVDTTLQGLARCFGEPHALGGAGGLVMGPKQFVET